MVQKISVSISDELDGALAQAAQNRRESKSSIIEIFLRENKEISNYLDRVRKQPTEGDDVEADIQRKVNIKDIFGSVKFSKSAQEMKDEDR